MKDATKVVSQAVTKDKPSLIQNSTSLPIPEEEKTVSPHQNPSKTLYDEHNTEYDDYQDDFEASGGHKEINVEPTATVNQLSTNHSGDKPKPNLKTTNQHQRLPSADVQSVKFSEVSSPNPKHQAEKPTNEIDPKKWDDAKV